MARAKLVGLVAAVFLTCTALPNAAAAVEFRFGHGQPATGDANIAGIYFKDLVEKATGGEVQISIFPGGQLGKEPQMVQGVRLGTVDLTVLGTPWWTTFSPKMNVLDIPYLLKDNAHAYRVLDGKVGRELLDGLEEHGIKGLAFWHLGFKHFTNNVRPIRTPEDFRNLKLRLPPNKSLQQALKIMGANPITMAFGDVYVSLQTGVIDGQENPVGIIHSNKFNEVQKFMSMTSHAYLAQVFTMNLRKFKALKPEHQQALMDAAAKTNDYRREYVPKQIEAQMQALRKSDMKVNDDVDIEAMRKLVFEPTVTEFTATQGRDLVDQIAKLRDM